MRKSSKSSRLTPEIVAAATALPPLPLSAPTDLTKLIAERLRGLSLSAVEGEWLRAVVKECVVVRDAAPDPGAHYRGPNLFGVPLDPYRVLEAYPNITREAARHVVKKVLRMGKKGIGERQLIAELRCCIDRWEKMLDEESAQAANQLPSN